MYTPGDNVHCCHKDHYGDKGATTLCLRMNSNGHQASRTYAGRRSPPNGLTPLGARPPYPAGTYSAHGSANQHDQHNDHNRDHSNRLEWPEGRRPNRRRDGALSRSKTIAEKRSASEKRKFTLLSTRPVTGANQYTYLRLHLDLPGVETLVRCAKGKRARRMGESVPARKRSNCPQRLPLKERKCWKTDPSSASRAEVRKRQNQSFAKDAMRSWKKKILSNFGPNRFVPPRVVPTKDFNEMT